MRYVSTRSLEGPRISLSDAILSGLAEDGGLYVPSKMPAFAVSDFEDRESLTDVAVRLLTPFLAGDQLAPSLAAMCHEALDFPVHLRPTPELSAGTFMLELFHGPTAAFKDVGARFLAGCFERMVADDERPLTVLVATSGDTGGAVAAALDGRANVRVVVLYPEGMVSKRQEKQLTCWGANVKALRVRGPFDACQKVVKAAFQDADLRHRYRLTSANSINIGRLLPQVAYHAAAALWCQRQTGAVPAFIVPTGNLGNALAAIWAKALGFPIRHVRLATNANRTIPDYLTTGEWSPSETIPTLASAMDVGDPSNMERLRVLYPDVDALRADVSADFVTDADIRARIRSDFEASGDVWCPHTATAREVYARLSVAEREAGPWVLVATAHPAKFESIVEPLIGRDVPVPPALEAILERPSRVTGVEADVAAVGKVLAEW